MHSSFSGLGSSRQVHHGGGVTVVSRGDGGVGIGTKVVVTRDEIERIAAAVARRQCGGGAGGAARAKVALLLELARGHRPADPATGDSLLRRVRDHGEIRSAVPPPPRSEPEEETERASRRGEGQPALDGIPEEA